MDLTVERVREYLIYDEATGKLSHRVRQGRLRRDDPATRRDSYGYLNVSIDGKTYKAHRVAWLYVHGAWPADQLDHINGKRDDNRIANLREAGYQENGQNRAPQRNSKSGYQGVSWYAARQKWRAQIGHAGKRYALGEFATAEQARDAYLAAKATLHDFQPAPRDGVKYGRNRKSRASL